MGLRFSSSCRAAVLVCAMRRSALHARDTTSGKALVAKHRRKWDRKGLSACDTVRALDRMLTTSLGFGLDRYMAAQKVQMGEHIKLVPESSADRPLLILVPDELKTGVQAANFLWGKGLRVMLGRDPCHRDWNDAKRAVERAGLWGPQTIQFHSTVCCPSSP